MNTKLVYKILFFLLCKSMPHGSVEREERESLFKELEAARKILESK